MENAKTHAIAEILTRVDAILAVDTTGDMREMMVGLVEQGVDIDDPDVVAQLTMPFIEREATHKQIVELLRAMYEKIL